MSDPDPSSRTERLRQMASDAWGGAVFVGAAFEQRVHLYSLEERREVASFDTLVDFGGRRLCLVRGPRVGLVTGAYYEQGVAGYALDGSFVWQNRAIRHPQRLAALSEQGGLFVGRDDGPGQLLDADTGEVYETIRGARQFFPGHRGGVLAGRSWFQAVDASMSGRSKRLSLQEGFAVLDASSSDEAFAVSEASGPVRGFDLDGSERWEASFDRGHAVSVDYLPGLGVWLAVARYPHDPGRFEAVFIDHGGAILDRRLLPPLITHTVLSALSRIAIVTPKPEQGSEGVVLELPTLTPEWTFWSTST